jgi:hypothetical protein
MRDSLVIRLTCDRSALFLSPRIEAQGWRPHRDAVGPLAPDRLVVAVVEGWRGEVVHALQTDASGALVHAKVQDPSPRNWLGPDQAGQCADPEKSHRMPRSYSRTRSQPATARDGSQSVFRRAGVKESRRARPADR